jgi:hypothetical protein
VQIIGLTWQLLFLAKKILQQAGYNSGVRLTFSLVGSRGTALANFSQETGEKNMRWNDPLIDPFGLSHISDNQKCTDSNLKIEHELVIGRLGNDESLKLLESVGRQVELAFNYHESPRFFNVETKVFPWKQFLTDQRW